MRHLFVPACLCLMTFSGSTVPDPKSMDRFAGFLVVKKNAGGETPVVEMTGIDSEAWPTLDSSRREARLQSTTAITKAEMAPQSAADDLQYFAELEAEGPPAPPPKPVIHRSRQEVCETLVEAAQTNDLPTPFFIRLLQEESGFRPGVVSPVGAQGVAQFMPGTALEMGVDNPFDPLDAIPASARLLKNLFQKFGNLGLAAAAYNAGPKRIQDWLEKKGKLPDETRGYVKTITGHEAESWKVAAAGMTNIKLPRIAPCQHDAGLHAWNGPKEIPMPTPSPRSAEPEVIVAHANSATVKLAERKKAESKPADAKKVDKNLTQPATIQLAAHKTQPKVSAKVEIKVAAKKPMKKPRKPLQLADAHR
jgi:hypothetical protein